MTGYGHPAYAAACAELGRPRQLLGCGGWILERPVPGGEGYDACGCYPLFCCPEWRALPDDLEAIGGNLVSLALVADPFGAHDPALLERAFPDLVRPFKRHFVVDLERPLAGVVSAHHRRNVRRALARLEIEPVRDPTVHLDEWLALYGVLRRRHAIEGAADFSPRSFAAQLRVPGLVAFRARAGNETVGMTLWYVQGAVAYYHLGAYAERGYRLGASFALFWEALGALRQVAAVASLGGCAGLRDDPEDGLARFKAGWATGTRLAWFCGRVFNPVRYRAIVRARGATAGWFFPAYRHEGMA